MTGEKTKDLAKISTDTIWSHISVTSDLEVQLLPHMPICRCLTSEVSGSTDAHGGQAAQQTQTSVCEETLNKFNSSHH